MYLQHGHYLKKILAGRCWICWHHISRTGLSRPETQLLRSKLRSVTVLLRPFPVSLDISNENNGNTHRAPLKTLVKVVGLEVCGNFNQKQSEPMSRGSHGENIKCYDLSQINKQ